MAVAIPIRQTVHQRPGRRPPPPVLDQEFGRHVFLAHDVSQRDTVRLALGSRALFLQIPLHPLTDTVDFFGDKAGERRFRNAVAPDDGGCRLHLQALQGFRDCLLEGRTESVFYVTVAPVLAGIDLHVTLMARRVLTHDPDHYRGH